MFGFYFLYYYLNIEKTAFGLNLKEAEDGITVAWGRGLVSTEPSSCSELELLLPLLMNPSGPWSEGVSVGARRSVPPSCPVWELGVAG